MSFWVYIMASWRRTLYVGVTNDIRRRVAEHKDGSIEGFTARYNVHRLVYFEAYGRVIDAIHREKQLKAFRRQKKVTLIESVNRDWKDLAGDWSPFTGWSDSSRR